MASNTVVRPCVVCSTPMETKRASKQTCSHKCYMQYHRAQQRNEVIQPATPQQQTHNEGSKIMSTKQQATPETPKQSQLFQPDAAHLKRLQDFEVGQYKTRTQCNIQGREQLGIFEEFDISGLQQALDRYVELVGQGYTATGEIRHVPKIIPTPTLDYLVLTLRKPESQVQKDTAEILARVEAEYLARLEADKAACVAKEVESLMAATRRKQLQAELDAKAAKEAEEYARVEAEVRQALGLGEQQ